jgi:hypothetical protein
LWQLVTFIFIYNNFFNAHKVIINNLMMNDRYGGSGASHGINYWLGETYGF